MKRLHPVRSCVLVGALLLVSTWLPAQLTWTSANVGLEGGSIHSLVATPGGSMLAGTTRGLLRFDASRDEWTQVIDAIGHRWQIAADRNGTLYATPKLSPSTLYRSSDDGRTWTQPVEPATVTAIVGDGSDVVLFGSLGRSTDGGVTWIATDIVDFSFMVSTGRGRYAAVLSHAAWLHNSTDGGLSWDAGAGIPHVPDAMTAIGDRVFVVGEDSLIVTTDGGASWTRPLNFPVRCIARIGSSSLVVSSQADDRRRTTDGIHRSDDSGRTWRQIASGYFQDLGASVDERIVAERHPGLALSVDAGSTWRPINTGLEQRSVVTWAESDRTFYGLADRGDIGWANGVRDLFRSTDDAASWQLVRDSVHQARTFFGGRGIATTHYTAAKDDPAKTRDSVIVSVDHGRTWTVLSAGTVLAVAAAGESVAAVSLLDLTNPARPNLYVTTDGGATWIARTTPTRHTKMAITGSGMIVVEMQLAKRTLAGSTDQGASWRTLLETTYVQGLLAPGGETIIVVSYDDSDTTWIIERSVDGGATFTRSKTRDAYVGVMRQVNAMTVMPMVTSNGTRMWRSGDSGATWTMSPVASLWEQGLPRMISPTGELFAYQYTRGNEGYIRSTDHGASWHMIDTTSSLSIMTSNGRVLVAAHPYGGVYRTTLPSGVERTVDSPAKPSLFVRPIPASDRLFVETRGAGTVTLVDLSGREVRRVIVDGTRGGTVLDVGGLAQGVYVVRMKSAAGISTARVVIVGD